jgi:phage gp36-like protein
MEKLLPYTMIVNLSNDSAAVVPNAANVSEAIDQADREIDSYLTLVMDTPADPVPPLIANISAKMAIWNLHLRKYFDSTIWRREYEDCLKLLLRIAEKKLSLGELETGVGAVVSGGSHAVETRHKKFNRRLWRTYP